MRQVYRCVRSARIPAAGAIVMFSVYEFVLALYLICNCCYTLSLASTRCDSATKIILQGKGAMTTKRTKTSKTLHHTPRMKSTSPHTENPLHNTLCITYHYLACKGTIELYLCIYRFICSLIVTYITYPKYQSFSYFLYFCRQHPS